MSGYQSGIEAITNGNKGTKKQLRRKIKEDPPEGRRGFASIGLLGRGHSPQSEAHIPQAAVTPNTADPIGRKRRRLVAVKPLGCFFVPLRPFVIASISRWYPDMTFGWGHTEDNDECVFYVQRAIWWRSNGM